jgi:chromosomal replication initiator protein
MPTPEERLTILRRKARLIPIHLSDEVLQLIAQLPCRHLTELEGALNRVSAFAELTRSPVSIDLARRALHPFTQPSAPSLDPQTILDVVCRHFHLSPDEIAGPSRARDIAFARHIAVYLLREHAHCSLTEIGRLLGHRDHSTILSAYRRIQRELRSHPPTRAKIEDLSQALDCAASASS